MNTQQTWRIGDCMDLLPDIDAGSIDMILCDMPYGTTACSWDTIIPLEPLWKEWKRIITDHGAIVLTACQPFTTTLISSNMSMFKYCWVWDKKGVGGFLNAKKRPLKRYEDIVVFANLTPVYYPIKEIRGDLRTKGDYNTKNGDGDMVYGKFRNQPSYNNEYYPTDIIEISNAARKNIVHPTQKPVALFEYLIKTYTNEGDLVHDSCLGSGTTLEACRRTNRNCIGFEINPQWEHLYPDRCMSHTPPLTSYFGGDE